MCSKEFHHLEPLDKLDILSALCHEAVCSPAIWRLFFIKEDLGTKIKSVKFFKYLSIAYCCWVVNVFVFSVQLSKVRQTNKSHADKENASGNANKPGSVENTTEEQCAGEYSLNCLNLKC